jgi:sulfur-oxidizing protein SoxX
MGVAMMNKVSIFNILLCLLLVSGCRVYPDNAGEFRFPIHRGDVARGQQAFVDLGCNQCHVVNGVDLPEYAGTRPFTVELGGELMYAKTYSDIATSIVNPDHSISDKYKDQLSAEERRALTASPMYVNEDMKVAQLIDLVAFLNSRYSLLPGYTEYYY